MSFRRVRHAHDCLGAFTRQVQIAAVAMTLCLVAVACGDGGQGASSPTPGSATTGAGGAGGEDPCVQVAFVYAGPTTTPGWDEAHFRGQQYLEDNLPCAEVTKLENIPESPESQRVFADLANQGNDIIFGTAFGYMDHMVEVSEQFPDVAFEHASGFKQTANLGNYFGAAEDGAYLSGLVAGSLTQSKLIGYVAPFPIPNIMRDLNGFVIGAREIDPEIQVQVIWMSSWYDAVGERQAAQTLVDAGADALAMNLSSPSVGETASEAGIGWVGFSTPSMADYAPDSFLTAPVYNWGVHYLDATRKVMDGTWAPGAYYGGLHDEFILLADYGPMVPQAVQDMVEQRKQEIIDGTFQIWAGPIADQDGNIVVPEGEVATLEHLLGVDYMIEGTLGEVPSS